MRTSYKFLALMLFSCMGCADKKLSKEDAIGIIKTDYPRVVDTYIYAGDPKYAVMLQEAGLDTDGYVIIKKTKKLRDTTGWIIFTEKSKPFLLETEEKDKKNLIQRVRTATENVTDITGIEQSEDGNSAVVTYQTMFIEITPFAKVVKLKEGVKTLKAYLVRDANGWHWEKRKTK